MSLLLVGGATTKGVDPAAEEELLENWIKELEQGMAGMTGMLSLPSSEVQCMFAFALPTPLISNHHIPRHILSIDTPYLKA